MNRSKVLIAAALAGAASLGAVAIAASPANTVAARQANFKTMGKGMKGIFDEFKKPVPDMAVIKASANAIAGAAPKVAGGFPKGTGPESGVKTHALPAIWTQNADFKSHAAKLVAAAKKLQLAANSGNLDAVKAAAPAVGGECKGCHDTYKARD